MYYVVRVKCAYVDAVCGDLRSSDMWWLRSRSFDTYYTGLEADTLPPSDRILYYKSASVRL